MAQLKWISDFSDNPESTVIVTFLASIFKCTNRMAEVSREIGSISDVFFWEHRLL
jgi:hypothetical protein